MSTDRDLPRTLRSWLHEDRHEVVEPIVDTVLAQVSSTPQRRSRWTAGRDSLVNKYLKYGLVAAAAVVIAVVAFNLLPGSPPPGGEPSATPEPTATPTPEPTPTPEAGLPVGSSHTLLTEGVTVTVTIPAVGWEGEVAGGVMAKNDNVDPPGGAGMIVFTGPLYVYGDACQWSTTQADTPSTTVDELVAALAAQTPRDASEPVDISVGGYAGKMITLHVPVAAAYSAGEFTDCDEGYFGSWAVTPDGGEPARYSQGPGAIDEVYVLDVDGVLTVIDTQYWAGTPAEHVDELRAIVESATFELP